MPKELLEIFEHDLKTIYSFLDAANSTHLQKVSAAASARRLILDKQPILDRTARMAGKKLWLILFEAFRQSGKIMVEDLPPVYHQIIEKHAGPNSYPCVLNRDAFISYELGILNYQSITPSVVIKLYANKLGGIHYDPDTLEDEPSKALSAFREPQSFDFGGIPLTFEGLAEAQLHRALRPVYLTANCLAKELQNQNSY